MAWVGRREFIDKDRKIATGTYGCASGVMNAQVNTTIFSFLFSLYMQLSHSVSNTKQKSSTLKKN